MEQKENKMGVMPVNKLLISMSLPMMISMLVQALYNIVDSIFVSRIDENALTAVSLAFPLQTLMIALGTGTGVGINALLSKSLGEKDFDKADKTAENGVFLALINYVVFCLIGFFLTKPFYLSQTRDPQIIEYGVQYLRIVCCCSFGMYAQFVFERLLQSTGKTVYTMITQSLGAVINIVLDPIFIFGYFGVPRMGVAGAAIATVIGQIVAGTAACIINLKANTEIHLRIKGFRPNGKIIGLIYEVGIPSIIMQSIGSVMTYGMNKILLGFSSTAAAVFGVYFKLQSFIFMPVFGLNNGMVPIIAYNYEDLKTQHSVCSDSDADRIPCIPGYAGQPAGTVRCVRNNACDRSSGTPDYQHQFSACRLFHCMRFDVPGSWKRCVQHAGIHCQTADCTASCSISAF